MERQTIEPSPGATTAHVVPPLHAVVVGPAVGGVVLLFAFVGLAALALGAFSGLARNSSITRRDRKAPL
jgi:hypothetical protein